MILPPSGGKGRKVYLVGNARILLFFLGAVIFSILFLHIETGETPIFPFLRSHAAFVRSNCRGRHVFIYDLPSKFNQELVDKCSQTLSKVRCDVLSNWGLAQKITKGDGNMFEDFSWWATDKFSLELIFHRRMQSHLCRVESMDKADLFYVPFYPALDYDIRLSTNPTKEYLDALALELAEWIKKQPAFTRYGGQDHFLVLGSPTWSFRRLDRINDTWGSKLEYIPEFESMHKLEVERHPWAPGNSMGVPYPTGFHPKLGNEVQTWMSKVQGSERNIRWSYAGFGHDVGDKIADTRKVLIQQCGEADNCKFLNCSEPEKCTPASSMDLYLKSQFSVQPKGDSFTTQAVFESLLGGSIPVFLWKETAYSQYLWHLPDPDSYSVYIAYDDLPTWTRVEDQLNKISPERVKQMQANVLKLIPNLLYFDPENKITDLKDAADLALAGLKQAVETAKLELVPKVFGSLDKFQEVIEVVENQVPANTSVSRKVKAGDVEEGREDLGKVGEIVNGARRRLG